MKRLTFGAQESIDAVAEYERLIKALPKYVAGEKNPRKRRKQSDAKPMARVQCVWCEQPVNNPDMYYSFTNDSAHVDCVGKMRARKAELEPAMGVK